MKRLVENPFLAFPSTVALAMALGVAWSLRQDDRLVVNEIFVVALLAVPPLAAGYAALVGEGWLRRLGTGSGLPSWDRGQRSWCSSPLGF